MRTPRKLSRCHGGTTSTSTTAAAASDQLFQTPKNSISRSPTPVHATALITRRLRGGSASQRRAAPSGIRRRTSGPFRRPLAEQALGAEDEDQDQDREHDRLRPVAARRVPGQPF